MEVTSGKNSDPKELSRGEKGRNVGQEFRDRLTEAELSTETLSNIILTISPVDAWIRGLCKS